MAISTKNKFNKPLKGSKRSTKLGKRQSSSEEKKSKGISSKSKNKSSSLIPKVEIQRTSQVYRLLEGSFLTDTEPKSLGYLGVLVKLSELGREVTPIIESKEEPPFYGFLENLENSLISLEETSASSNVDSDEEDFESKDVDSEELPSSSRIEVKFL